MVLLKYYLVINDLYYYQNQMLMLYNFYLNLGVIISYSKHDFQLNE